MTALRPATGPARIFTFYSFKGGVGRTMALANTAVVLADAHDQRVICIDWDLEAPGLHYYFGYTNSELATRKGLLEYLNDFRDAVARGKYGHPPTLSKYLLDVGEKLAADPSRKGKLRHGRVQLLHCGCTDAGYMQRVQQFDWQAFYEKSRGFEIIETLRKELLDQADIVLIDARAGQSDVGATPTVQLPDTLLTLFTSNDQSLAGTEEIIRRATQHPLRREENLPQPRVVMLPARVFSDEEVYKRWVATTVAPVHQRLLEAGLISLRDSPTELLETGLPVEPKCSVREQLVVLDDDYAPGRALREAYKTLARRIIALRSDLPVLESRAAASEPVSSADHATAEQRLKESQEQAGRAAMRGDQFALARWQVEVADAAMQVGDLNAASHALLPALTIAQSLGVPQYVFPVLGRVGDVRVAQGDLPGALQAYTDGLEIARKLAARDPSQTEWQRDLSVSWERIGDVRRAQGDLPGALQAYTDSLETRRKLAARDPSQTEWQRDLSIGWNKIGDVRRAQGDLAGALQAYTDGLEIARKLAARDPSQTEWQRDLSVSWNKIGDACVAQGDLPGASQAYTDGLEIARKLAARDPSQTEWQRDLSVSWERIGDVRRAQGDLPGALQAYTDSLEIAQKLAARDPSQTAWQRDLSIGWNKIGDVRRAQGDLPGALQAYTDSLEIRRKLAARDPSQTEWQRDLSISWNKIGDVRRAQGDLPGASQAYTDGLEIARKLAARDPSQTEWQRDLSVSWNKIGDVRRAQGDLPGALQAYTDSLETRRKLAARDPSQTEWQRDLSIGWNKIGDVRVAQGDLPGALQAYTDAFEIARKLTARDPSQTEWQRDLFVSEGKLGVLAMQTDDRAAARAHFEAALTIIEKLVQRDPTNAQWREDHAWVQNALRGVDEAPPTASRPKSPPAPPPAADRAAP